MCVGARLDSVQRLHEVNRIRFKNTHSKHAPLGCFPMSRFALGHGQTARSICTRCDMHEVRTFAKYLPFHPDHYIKICSAFLVSRFATGHGHSLQRPHTVENCWIIYEKGTE